MKKQEMQFAIEKKGGVVQRIGKGVIIQPAIHYNGKGIKWFDDNQLVRESQQGAKKMKGENQDEKIHGGVHGWWEQV